MGLTLLLVACFRISGVDGDLLPIIEFRWASRPSPGVATVPVRETNAVLRAGANDYPQFLGPDRNGVLTGVTLDTNWTAHPPVVVWRQAAGAACSGFAIVGDVCFTQEQRGGDECVVAYDLLTGRQLWLHADAARYETTIAGEGPRSTPTVVSNRMFTAGATGILNCLNTADGRVFWSRNVVADSGGVPPPWGYAGEPLVVDDLVIVPGWEKSKLGLYAYRAADGQPVWSAGSGGSYAAPVLATLAGVRQVLAFNERSLSGHDPVTGAVLWEKPWGNGNVVCSSPVVVGTNRVVYSSGYGYGAQFLEISAGTNAGLSADVVWKSNRMKSKFGHLFVRGDCLYGLDDGIFACVSLKDGSLRWKEGRYGHGQGLLVGDVYLLMMESGELVLLQPTPEAPHEIARFPVFSTRTWNPMALSGDRLLVRNDREMVCLRLALRR